MTYSPLISVIMPVYNASEFIEEALHSLVAQTYSNIEIITVDDGSVDNSLAILEKIALSEPRLSVHKKQNGGACSAKNYALKYAKGEYIFILDADDFISKNALSDLYFKIQETNTDACIIPIKLNHQNKVTDFKVYPKETLLGSQVLKLSIDWQITTLGLFKKSVYEGVLFDESNMHGDELTSRLLVSRCESISFSQNATYFYRMHLGSATKKPSFKRLDILDNLMSLKNLLQDSHIYTECRNIYLNEFLKCYQGMLKMVLFSFYKLERREIPLIIKKLTIFAVFFNEELKLTSSFKASSRKLALTQNVILFIAKISRK